jgi:hypothetical protein
LPYFITKNTLWVALKSVTGLPGTATISAAIPFRSAPDAVFEAEQVGGRNGAGMQRLRSS